MLKGQEFLDHQTNCCGYGNAGVGQNGYDCVMIPGATKFTGKTQRPVSICGRSYGLVTVTGTAPRTVCSEWPSASIANSIKCLINS